MNETPAKNLIAGPSDRPMRSIPLRAALFISGMLSVFVAAMVLAEAYLRLAPPEEIRPFLGDESGLSGPYRSDPTYGIAYRSADAFRQENATRLDQQAALFEPGHPEPVWAFFGNSFVQAGGMLADTVRMNAKDRRVFNLGLNTPLPIRFAQVDLLLRLGLRPQRIFFSIMPIDTSRLGHFPLDSIHVTAGGGISYQPRLPGSWPGRLVRSSRIAFASWVRTGNHRVNRDFSLARARTAIDEPMLTDLLRLFSALSEVTANHNIPVTVMLIPDHNQLVEAAPFGFQDSLTPHLEALGFDVFDPRETLLAHARPAALFIPDGHYAKAGNDILVEALLQHVQRVN